MTDTKDSVKKQKELEEEFVQRTKREKEEKERIKKLVEETKKNRPQLPSWYSGYLKSRSFLDKCVTFRWFDEIRKLTLYHDGKYLERGDLPNMNEPHDNYEDVIPELMVNYEYHKEKGRSYPFFRGIAWGFKWNILIYFIIDLIKHFLFYLSFLCTGYIIDFITEDRSEDRLPYWIILCAVMVQIFDILGDRICGCRWNFAHIESMRYVFGTRHIIYRKIITMQQGNTHADMSEGKIMGLADQCMDKLHGPLSWHLMALGWVVLV